MTKNGAIVTHAEETGADRRAWLAIFVATAACLTILFALRLSSPSPGGSGMPFLLLVGLVFVAVPVAVFLPPTIPLFLAVMFLESPLPLLVDNQPSALITAGLLAWSAFGSLFVASRTAGASSRVLLRSVWFFGAYAVISALRGFWVGNSTEYIVGDLFHIEEFVIIFILISRLTVDEKSGLRLLKCALAATFFNTLWQLVISVAGLNFGEELPSLEGDVAGSLPRTINLDAIYLFVLLLSLYPVIKSSRHRVWFWLLLAPTIANLLFSFTRGVWLASVVAVFVCGWLQSKEQRIRLLKLGIGIVLFVAVASAAWRVGDGGSETSLLDAIEERLSFGVAQVEEGWNGDVQVETRRFVEMAMIASQVLSSPFLGAGMGGLYSIDTGALISHTQGSTTDFHYMHNLYLRVAFRMGLIGLAAFGCILYFYFRDALRCHFAMPRDPWRCLTGGLIAAVAGQAVLSLTSPTLLEHPMSGLAACAMALTFCFQDASVPRLDPANAAGIYRSEFQARK